MVPARRIAPSAVVVLALSLAACSAGPPRDLGSRPVVEFGSPMPSADAVLKLPAGKPIPARAEIQGSLLAKGASADMTVALARDVYLYRRWASYDGVHWKPAADLVRSSFKIETPSSEHPVPGLVRLQFDDRTAMTGADAGAAARPNH